MSGKQSFVMSYHRRQLPEWVRSSLVTPKAFGEAYGRLVRFFKEMALA